MKSSSTADAIIVGGGFSGTMLAAQLAKRGLRPVIVEGGGRAGRGAAYSTDQQAHLLNVVAGRMSAWPDAPDDFAQAVDSEGYGAGDFVPRMRFGAYISDILARSGAEVVEGRAVAARPTEGGWQVTLADSQLLRGQVVVLAGGNMPPERPRFATGISAERFVEDPWSDVGREALRQVAQQGGDVLVIGTGLTMVDIVLSLDQAGHGGAITALSRRGLVPRSHAPDEMHPEAPEDVPEGNLLGLWRWIRRRSAQVGWRDAITSLRSTSQDLWRALPHEQQQRFLRHARPWWDVHRHRIAPQVAGVLNRLIGEGRLEIMAGRIASLREIEEGLDALIRRRGSDRMTERRFALAVNCTGPLGSIARTRDPLLRMLIDGVLVRPDALGMGLQVDGSSRVSGAAGLWALGPLTKGIFWEIVAVPDIRVQAAEVAEDIARELTR